MFLLYNPNCEKNIKNPWTEQVTVCINDLRCHTNSVKVFDNLGKLMESEPGLTRLTLV